MQEVGSATHGVHLVGSVPLANAEEVFLTCAGVLGDRLTRLPDGETGERTNWIRWQHPRLSAHPSLETTGGYMGTGLRDGADAGEIRFGPLGYADAALSSFKTFDDLQSQGRIPAHLRFQVSLPTPLAPIAAFVRLQDQAALEPAYERAMLAEVAVILDGVPHEHLAIQWDTAVEFGILEGVFPSWFDDPYEDVVRRLLRMAAAVPASVEMGFHLCYGDAEHKHFVEPTDTSKLVEVANAIAAGVTRSLDWVHLPVPRDRHDSDYFAPLADLRLQAESELYLGAVHATDGVAGTRARIDVAAQIVPRFGVATECGMGRRDPATVHDLLAVHAAVAGPVV